MNVLVITAMTMVVGDPLPFEEEKGASPPPLLLGFVTLPRLVFGNRLLELEVDGIYGRCCLALVPSCFLQHLLFFTQQMDQT